MTAPSRRGRGGQGGHEPRVRILAREQRVLDLAVLGWRQHHIARELGISQAAVSKILKRVELRLARETEETKDRQRIRHSLKLDAIHAEAMAAFVASKADSTRRTQRKHLGSSGRGGETIAEIVSESQHGDPRCLEVARKALADQRKLWGANAPTSVELQTQPNPYAEMNDDELRAKSDELERQLALCTSHERSAPPEEAVIDACLGDTDTDRADSR